MMNEIEAIQARHSVRNYSDKKIEATLAAALEKEIKKYNEESGLHMQLVLNSEDAFKSMIPMFGRFKGVKNYIALVGKETSANLEKCGYYGARLAILAQRNGLNSCFVTSSFKPTGCKVSLSSGEKVIGVIALGYGKTNGQPHKSKELKTLGKGSSDWFKQGLKAAALAPTGLNRQNFFLEECKNKVRAKALNEKPMTQIDLGIVKYHFEAGSKKDSSVWMD